MLKDKQTREQTNKEKSPQAKTKQATKDPCQSLKAGKVPSWERSHDLQGGQAAPAPTWRRKPWQHGSRTSPRSPAVFRCIASTARAAVPQPRSDKMLSRPPALARRPTTCAGRRRSPAKVSGNFCRWLWCRQDFPPRGRTPPPEARAWECLCVYIRFTVQSTYRKAFSLFKGFSSTSYFVKSDPRCRSRSFSRLNGVKEPFSLPTAAITIRLGGRGNEQRSTRCTFQPPAIVKSTLLQTEWQQGTGWEAGGTCQEHQSRKSWFLIQTSTPASQLPLTTKLEDVLQSCCSALESLTNAFTANQELIFSCRRFGRSSAKSPSFFSSTRYHSITFHVQQFALRKSVSRCFAVVWVLYSTVRNLFLLAQLVFLLLSSESPTSKGCPGCGSPNGILYPGV